MSSRQDEKPQPQLPMPPRRERLKVINACQSCRASKVKCDGNRPGKACNYGQQDSTSLKGQSKQRAKAPTRHARPSRSRATITIPITAPTPIHAPTSPLTTEVHLLQTPPGTHTPSTTAFSGGSDLEQGHEARDESHSYYTAYGRFAGQVSSTIDKIAGPAADATCYLVPFVDAPLFGDIGEQPPRTVLDFTSDLPRAYADRLPILDQQRFSQANDAFYNGSAALVQVDRDIWLSTLNVVFALGVQIQESIPMKKRDDEANRYFQSAWELLRPEVILWKPGSLELVQYLLLINRYLYCTNN
ncbi:Sorbicillinoid biosynthetic cluster transcription factor sor3 [Metarhizium anisopliae]|nr:Sorbicillinoid biosynthetic cluster transcription factor sor3 [Metarhizium anisopliae]